MPEDPLEERLAAVERALDEQPTNTTPAGDGDLRERLMAVEDDVAELEAAVQAIRGYVGGVKHVNDEVEQRADAAMAKAEAVERAVEATPREHVDRDDPAAGVQCDGTTAGHQPASTDPDNRSVQSPNRTRAGTQTGRRADEDAADPAHHERSTVDRERCPHCGGATRPEGRADGGRAAGGPASGAPAPDPGDRRAVGGVDGEGPAAGGAPGAGVRDTAGPPDDVGEHTLGDPEESAPTGLLARIREVL